MAQVFFVTSLSYAEPLYDKAARNLRIPMGFEKDRPSAEIAYRVNALMALQMQRLVFIDKEDNVVLQLKDGRALTLGNIQRPNFIFNQKIIRWAYAQRILDLTVDRWLVSSNKARNLYEYARESNEYVRQDIVNRSRSLVATIYRRNKPYIAGIKEIEAMIESWCERNAVGLPSGWAENKNKEKGKRAAYLTAQVKSWFAAAFQEDDPRIVYKLFNAKVDITGLPFCNLPIFPVNEKGEIDAELMSWMMDAASPSEAYLAAKKVSLEDLTISSFIASANDAERKESAQILKAFAETRLSSFRGYFKATSSDSQNIREIDHILVAVSGGIYDIARRFGTDVQEEAAQGALIVRTAYGIEIIQPIKGHPRSRELVSFLEKRANPAAVYSVALETREIENTLASINQTTPLALIIDKTPRTNSAGDKTAFIHPRATQSRMLVELIEHKNIAASSGNLALSLPTDEISFTLGNFYANLVEAQDKSLDPQSLGRAIEKLRIDLLYVIRQQESLVELKDIMEDPVKFSDWLINNLIKTNHMDKYQVYLALMSYAGFIRAKSGEAIESEKAKYFGIGADIATYALSLKPKLEDDKEQLVKLATVFIDKLNETAGTDVQRLKQAAGAVRSEEALTQELQKKYPWRYDLLRHILGYIEQIPEDASDIGGDIAMIGSPGRFIEYLNEISGFSKNKYDHVNALMERVGGKIQDALEKIEVIEAQQSIPAGEAIKRIKQVNLDAEAPEGERNKFRWLADNLDRYSGYDAILPVGSMQAMPGDLSPYEPAGWYFDPRYGTDEDLKYLIGKAREKGIDIEIVIDVVLAHTGTDSSGTALPDRCYLHNPDGTRVKVWADKLDYTNEETLKYGIWFLRRLKKLGVRWIRCDQMGGLGSSGNLLWSAAEKLGLKMVSEWENYQEVPSASIIYYKGVRNELSAWGGVSSFEKLKSMLEERLSQLPERQSALLILEDHDEQQRSPIINFIGKDKDGKYSLNKLKAYYLAVYMLQLLHYERVAVMEHSGTGEGSATQLSFMYGAQGYVDFQDEAAKIFPEFAEFSRRVRNLAQEAISQNGRVVELPSENPFKRTIEIYLKDKKYEITVDLTAENWEAVIVSREVQSEEIRDYASAHFSLRSIHNSLTEEGIADKFQIRGVTYTVDDPKIADINKLGEPMTIALQSGQNITFTIRGPTISKKLREYLAKALPEALSRSSALNKTDPDNNITIILADKYDFLAGDHRKNNLIILNASDLEAMIRQGENAAYVNEFIISLLSEELAHERGAQGDAHTEEKLANLFARKTIINITHRESEQYIAFVEKYGENFEDQKGYLRYLKRHHSVVKLMDRIIPPLRKRAVQRMFDRTSSLPLKDVPVELEERFLNFLKGVFIEGVFVTFEEIKSQMPDELIKEIPEDSMRVILEDFSYAGYVAKLTIEGKEGYHLLDLGELASESPLGQQIWGTRFFPYTQRGILDVQRSGHWTFLPRNVRNYYLKDSYLKSLKLEEQAAVDLFIEAYVKMARTLTEKQRESAPEELREKYEDKFIDEFLSEANLRALWKTRKRLLDSFPNPGELPVGVRELTEEKFIETFHNLRANPEAVKAAFSKLNEAFENLRQEMPKVKTRKQRDELVQGLERAMSNTISDLLGVQYAGSAFSYSSMIHFYAEIFAIVYEPAYAGKPTFVVYYIAERLRQQIFGLADFYKQEKDRSNRAALSIFPKFYNSFAPILGWDIPEATLGETLEGTLVGVYTGGVLLDTQVLFETYIKKGKTLPIVKEVWDKYKENFSGEESLERLAALLFMYGSLSKLSLICAAVNAMDLGDPRFQKEAQDKGFNEASWLVDKIGDVIVRGFQGNHINEFFEMTANAYLAFEIKKKEKGWKEKPAKPSERIDDAERPKIILLTDNAGEAVFDMLLVKYLLGLGFNVVIASRDVPVINDMTEKDMEALVDEMKLVGYFGEHDDARLKVISSGSKIFGTSVKDIELGSAFLREYSDKNTIYVIAKGQGNAESLWQGEWSKPFVHILTSKEPEKVEEFVKVPKHSALLLVNVPAQEKIAGEEGDVLTETVSLKNRPDILSALNAAGKNVMIIHEENIYIYLGEFGENLTDEFINCFEGDNIILDASKGPIYLGKARIGSGSYLMAENGDVRVRGGARLGKDCVIKDSAIVSATIENGEIVTRRTIDVDREGNTRRFRRTAVKSFISPEGIMKMKIEPLSINKALRKKLEGSGVLITGDPSTIYIDDDVKIESGVTIGPNVILVGKTEIKKGAKIGSYVCLIASKVMEGVELSRLNASGCVFNSGLNIGGIAQLLRNEEIYTYTDVPRGSSAVGLIISPALEKGEKGIIGVRVRGKKSRTLSYNLLEEREAPKPLRFAEIREKHLDLFDVLLEQAAEAINEARIQLAAIHEDRVIDKELEGKILGAIKTLLDSSIVDELAFWEVKDLMWQIIRVYAGSPFQIMKKEADENALMRIGYLVKALDEEQEPDKRLELAIKIAAFSNINIFDRRKAEEGFYSKTNNPISKFEDILSLSSEGADVNLLLSSIHDAGYLAVDKSGNIIKRLLETPESERQDKTVVFNINNAGEAVYILILAREVLKLGYKVVLAANPEPIDDNYDVLDLKELLENPLVSDRDFLGDFLASGKIKAVSNGSPGAGLYLNKVSREFYEIAKDKDTIMMVSVGYESTRDAFTESLPLDCAYLCWVKRSGAFKQVGLDVKLGEAIVAFVEKGGKATSAAISPDQGPKLMPQAEPAKTTKSARVGRRLPLKLFTLTLAALLLSACSPDPTFVPMLLKDVIVVFGGLMLFTGVGAGTIAFLAIHDKTVNFKSVGIAIIGTALILVSAAILLTNYPLSHFAEDKNPTQQVTLVTEAPTAASTPNAMSAPEEQRIQKPTENPLSQQEQSLVLSMNSPKVVSNKHALIDTILATNSATGVNRFHIDILPWIQQTSSTTKLVEPVNRDTISTMLADVPEAELDFRITLEQGPYAQFLRIAGVQKPPHFSMRSKFNSLTQQGHSTTERFSVAGKEYDVSDMESVESGLEKLGVIAPKSPGVNLTFTTRGSPRRQGLLNFLRENPNILINALGRSQILHDGELSQNITIVFADQYDFIAGDHKQNNVIILNASDLEKIISSGRDTAFIFELITSVLSEELAHERGADGSVATEEKLAASCANSAVSLLSAERIKQYINFIREYEQDLETQKGYLSYLAESSVAALKAASPGQKIKSKILADARVAPDKLNARVLSDPSNASLRLVESVSGIRGDFGLDPEVSEDAKVIALAYGYNYALYMIERWQKFSPAKTKFRFVIGHDPRPTGEVLERLNIIGMMMAAKEKGVEIEILDIGVAPIPIVESAICTFNADGGVMISASHNPLKANGFKYLTGAKEPEKNSYNENGGILNVSKIKYVISGAKILLKEISEGDLDFVSKANAFLESNLDKLALLSSPESVASYRESAIEGYIEFVKKVFGISEEALADLRQRNKNIKVVVDPNGGSSCGISSRVLEYFGFDVIEINAQIGEPFHKIEPVGEAMQNALDKIKESGAAFALVLDFDADRGNTAFIDSGGNIIEPSPQDVAYLNVANILAWIKTHSKDYPLAEGKKWAIVVHDATSLRNLALCEKLGIEVVEVEIGEANVVTKMHQLEQEGYFVPIGIEGYNGGTILFGSNIRDGTQTALLSLFGLSNMEGFNYLRKSLGLEEWKEKAYSLQDILNSLPVYYTAQSNIFAETELSQEEIKDGLENAFEAKVKYLDGTNFTLGGLEGAEFASYEFLNYEETRVLHGKSSRVTGTGGFKILLTDIRGNRHFMWFRGSKTEKGVFRICADSSEKDLSERLFRLQQELYKEAIAQDKTDKALGLAVIEKIRQLQTKTTGIKSDTVNRKIKQELDEATYHLQERVRIGGNNNFYVRVGEEYFEIANGEIKGIDKATFEKGHRILIKVMRSSYTKEQLILELEAVVAELKEKLKRPPNIRETAEAMPSLEGSRDPAALLYKYFQSHGMDPYDYGIEKFSGKANITVNRKFKFSGTRIFLPPQLDNMIQIAAERTPISNETKIYLVDINNPGNRLTLEHLREQDTLRLTYVQPSGKTVTSEVAGVKSRTSVTLALNPVFSDFYDTVFSIPLDQGKDRLKAIADHLRNDKFGSCYVQLRKEINFHGDIILPSWYNTHPGMIRVYRDRESDARFLIFEDTANPDNIVGYEWREGRIIPLEAGEALETQSFVLTQGKKMPQYYLHKSPVFGDGFDSLLDKSAEVIIASPGDNRLSDISMGTGRFAFRVDMDVVVTSFEGERSALDIARDDRTKYPIRIVRSDDGSEIKIRYNDPAIQGEFIIEGLSWEDGSPVILKAPADYEGNRGYFNISTIIEMVRQNLLPGVKASDWLLETFGFHAGSEQANLTNPIRSYRVEQADSGTRFLVEDVMVDPHTFLPLQDEEQLIPDLAARTGV